MAKYSDEKNVQLLLALLKAHGIRNVVASPGGTNVSVVGSLQNDQWFNVISAVDERHAAYLACGMSLETNAPVMLSCTGATASRNYMPALTEAFYRKLPILVVTSSQIESRVGNLFAQVTDRSKLPSDIVNFTAHVHPVKNQNDWIVAEQTINSAILSLERRGGGPSHINLETEYVQTFETDSLPAVQTIRRIDATFSGAPDMSPESRILLWIGSHRKFTAPQMAALNAFVESHNAVVLHDHSTTYEGSRGIVSAIGAVQTGAKLDNELSPDLIIHLGEVSGDYSSVGYLQKCAEVWRVSPDGEIRNTFGKLSYVFEMPEELFFLRYAKEHEGNVEPTFSHAWQSYVGKMRDIIPELPFSNTWIAKVTSQHLPAGSTIHFAILNSLRSWNNFDLPTGVACSSNVGGFGIDGCTSTLVGASLIDSRRLCFLVTGDLAFFYDLNAMGNRHIGNNLRILLVNNGSGAEFFRFERVKNQLGEGLGKYIAAEGHFAKKSRRFVRHIAEDLGFRYYAATNKDEYLQYIEGFVAESEKPILIECFTDPEDDVAAAKILETLDCCTTIKSSVSRMMPTGLKSAIKAILVK